jgi:hypothetical protein
MPSWAERARRAAGRYEDGAARPPDAPNEQQRQLTRMGNAAWAAGLSLPMADERDEGRQWLLRVAERYCESWPLAPPESWGRPIGTMKARLVAGDRDGASADADWALAAGAAESESAIGRYAAVLALLVLDRDTEAGELTASLAGRDDFPGAVADALAALSASDGEGYETAIRVLLADFESREDFLEDVPVADTVIALEVLDDPRGIAVRPAPALLPPP